MLKVKMKKVHKPNENKFCEYKRELTNSCRYEMVFIFIRKTTFFFSSVLLLSFIDLVGYNTNFSTEAHVPSPRFPALRLLP